jgi:hypothetical protein
MSRYRGYQRYMEYTDGSTENKMFLIFKLMVNFISETKISITTDRSLPTI